MPIASARTHRRSCPSVRLGADCRGERIRVVRPGADTDQSMSTGDAAVQCWELGTLRALTVPARFQPSRSSQLFGRNTMTGS